MRAVTMQIAALEAEGDSSQDEAPAAKPANRPVPSPKPSSGSDHVDYGADPQLGVWKLNLTKSKFGDDPPMGETQRIGSAKGAIKVIDETTMPSGRVIHSEWTVKYDGKDASVKGVSGHITIAMRRIDANTFEFHTKRDGNPVVTGRIVCSEDGKSKTITTTTGNSKNSIEMVWDRQNP